MIRAFILAKHCLFPLSIMSQDEVNIGNSSPKMGRTQNIHILTTYTLQYHAKQTIFPTVRFWLNDFDINLMHSCDQ